MSGLPNSFLLVLGFIALAIGLILYFVSRQVMFRRHKRRGDEALKRGDYRESLRCFARAESLWELNVTQQTIRSYQGDLAMLEEVLNGLQSAARAGGISLPVAEYCNAVKVARSEFQGNPVGERASSGKAYASAFMRLKGARSTLREQLRALNLGDVPHRR